ncbi:MAG: hypothetical protein A49_11780 [Methyloceanibacter sp.]|nr:MAG: hypothetical protein A49_11780 [Methyloceanibacter sp.]
MTIIEYRVCGASSEVELPHYDTLAMRKAKICVVCYEVCQYSSTVARLCTSDLGSCQNEQRIDVRDFRVSILAANRPKDEWVKLYADRGWMIAYRSVEGTSQSVDDGLAMVCRCTKIGNRVCRSIIEE